MSTALIQHWQAIYLCAALLAAAVTIVVGDHLRDGEPPAASTRCGVALTAGALWPVMLVGLLQLLVVDRTVGRARRRTPAHRAGNAPVEISPVIIPERELVVAGSR